MSDQPCCTQFDIVVLAVDGRCDDPEAVWEGGCHRLRIRGTAAQVEKFSSLMGGPNNRPVQPLNARMVLQ